MTDEKYADNYEDVSMYALDDEREQRLLDAQTECTFMWSTSAGDPVGVIMNYLAKDGRFWLTCTRRRKRVPAIEARPRVAIAVTSRGTDIGISQAVTYKGNAIVHDDADTKAWFYAALAARVRPDNASQQASCVRAAPRQPRARRDRDSAGQADRLRLREHVRELAGGVDAIEGVADARTCGAGVSGARR